MSSPSNSTEPVVPIDVQYSKLLDWLISRGKVSRTWQVSLRSVRERVDAALADMPDHPEVTDTLRDVYIDYYQSKKLLEVLKKYESDTTKNFFGRYSSQRLNDWQRIIAAYERDNLYLAESAFLLMKNVNYDLKSMRESLNKDEKSILDQSRKQTEYAGRAQDYDAQYQRDCEELGIKGLDVANELRALTATFPDLCTQLAHRMMSTMVTKLETPKTLTTPSTTTHPLHEALAYHDAWTDYLDHILTVDQQQQQQSTTTTASSTLTSPTSTTSTTTLKVLRFVCENGNAPIWKLLGLAEPPPPSSSNNNNNCISSSSSVPISGGGGGGGSDNFDDIDWGDDSNDTTNTNTTTTIAANNDNNNGDDDGEIDWGDDSDVAVVVNDNDDGIDWGVDDVGEENSNNNNSSNSNNNDKKFSSLSNSELSMTILAHPPTRSQLMNDLAELSTFLEQRLKELQSVSELDHSLFTVYFPLPPLVQSIEANSRSKSTSSSSNSSSSTTSSSSLDCPLVGLISSVREIVSTFHQPKWRQMLLLLNSPTYADRLASMIAAKSISAEKMRNAISTTEKTVQDLAISITKTKRQLEAMRLQTLSIKRDVEKSMSTMFAGRPIHIVGEINTI